MGVYVDEQQAVISAVEDSARGVHRDTERA